MGYERISVRPLSGALGAEIAGVNLAESLDDSTFADVRRALLDHLVIFFRDQRLTPEQHKAFSLRFGELDVHPFAKGLDAHPEVLPVVKEADDRGINFGGTWHSDVTFYEKPALGSVLYCLDAPAWGGDTLFANMYLAYESLSDGMKDMLQGMNALHNAARSYGTKNSRQTARNEAGSRSMQVRTGDDAERTVSHPVVRTHPESGRKGLFVNQVFTQRFDGWTEEESRPLLQWLFAHAVRPEFTCRFRWEKGSIAFWDNRCTQHFALNDYFGQRREMHRVTICGDRPFLDRGADGRRLTAA